MCAFSLLKRKSTPETSNSDVSIDTFVPSGKFEYRVKIGDKWAIGCEWLQSKDDAYGIAHLNRWGLGLGKVRIIEAEIFELEAAQNG